MPDTIRSRDNRLLLSALDLIGNTPLVELSRICAGLDGRILAKCEFLNPGGSKKDRIALQIVRDAEADGRLTPGQPVVELTSGNTGAGLAIVCSLTGHPFVAVMSKGNTVERAQMMRGLGAEVVLVDQAPGSPHGQVSGEDLALVEAEAQRIVRDRGAFRADQFELGSNYRAHYLGTGPEILRQADRIDAFCDFVGTGGSFAGCAKAFKEHDPSIACYIVEPAGSPALAGGQVANPSHRIQGGGYSRRTLTMLEESGVQPDGYLTITDDEAIACAHRLAKEEGLFVGFSSGANLAAALQLLAGPHRGASLAILLNDTGLKYMSMGMWKRSGAGLLPRCPSHPI